MGVWSFLKLGRPWFLAGGFLLYHLGVAMALFAGATLQLRSYLLGQAAVSCVQLMTHYSNEYFDLPADRANSTPTTWAGGSRVLPAGSLPPAVAKWTAIVFGLLGVGAMATLFFLSTSGRLAIPAMLLAAFLAWEYSAPPLRLHSRGLGEVTASLIVALLTPMTGFLLHAERISVGPLLATIPLWMLQAAMSVSLNIPDAAGDIQGGKRTLVARLGRVRSVRTFGALLVAAFACLPALVALGLPSLVAVTSAGMLPLAGYQLWRTVRGDWDEPANWNTLPFGSIALFMGTALMQLLAFLGLAGGVRWP